jgi:anti-sigma B factor antagonist
MDLIIIEESNDLTYVALAGRLDHAGVEAIAMRFQQCVGLRKRSAVVNLAEVNFMSSLGMRMLLSNYRSLKEVGGKLVLLKPQPLVEDTLKAAMLDQIFPIVHDEIRALEIARKQPQ